MGNRRSDAVGAEPSEAGRRVVWRKNTATAAADSTDAFQGGLLKGALGYSHLAYWAALPTQQDNIPKMALPSDFGLVFKGEHADLAFCLDGDFSHLSHRNCCQIRSCFYRTNSWGSHSSVLASLTALCIQHRFASKQKGNLNFDILTAKTTLNLVHCFCRRRLGFFEILVVLGSYL